jgi:hypothetical protein
VILLVATAFSPRVHHVANAPPQKQGTFDIAQKKGG